MEASNAAHDIKPIAFEIDTKTSNMCFGDVVEGVTIRDVIKRAGATVEGKRWELLMVGH